MAFVIETKYDFFLTLVRKDEVLLDNLVPICEQAIEGMQRDVALKCLDYYFSRSGPKTQYLQRAYNCKALLSIPHSVFDYDSLIEMGDNFIKAVELFQAKKIYQFLVINSSVDFMESSRALILPTTRKYFLKPLLCISKALDTCREVDAEWRVLILQQLILCLLDCGRIEEANKLINVMLELSKTVSDDLLRESQLFVLSNNICDLTNQKISNEISNSAKVKRLRCYLLNICFISLSDLTTLFRCFTLPEAKIQPLFEDTTLISLFPREILEFDSGLRSVIILLIALVAFNNGHLYLADQCLIELQQMSPFNAEIDIFYSYLLLSLKAKKITNRINSKKGLRKFLFFISGLCQQVFIANASHNIDAIEIGSSLIWHLSLVLLQPRFRKHVKRTLFKISSLLNEISSKLHSLRAYYFRELALCEEQDQEFELALDHFEQSLKFINDEHWIIAQNSDIYLLKIKMCHYSFTSDPLNRAIQLLNQIIHVKEKSKFRETLLLVGELLIGHSLSTFLDTQEHNRMNLHKDDPVSILNFLDRSVDLFIASTKRIQLHTLPTGRDRLRCQVLFKLSKTSRQMELWDISRIASRFCLLYNDGRWGTFAKLGNLELPSEKELIYSTENSLVASKASIASGRGFENHSSLKFRDEGILQMFAETLYILAEGIVQYIFKKDLQLYLSPNLTSFNLKDFYKDDQRWLKFCSLMDTLSVTAVDRFVLAGQWALELNQRWLISNCLVCFWNYTKHLYFMKKEIVLLQPIRDIYSLIISKTIVQPRLLSFKLSLACINCIYQASLLNIFVPPVMPATTLNKSFSKNEREKKKINAPILSSGLGAQLEVVSEEFLKEANEICYISFSLLVNIDSNVSYFKQLVSIWVKILIQLSQTIRLEFLIELFKDSDDLYIMKAIVIIEVLSSNNSNLLVPEITLSSAFDCLTCSKGKNNIINLELMQELAGLYLDMEDYSMVTSCVEYGRNIGNLLLSENKTRCVRQKIYYYFSQLESILALCLSRSKPFAKSRHIFNQILIAFCYANESNFVKLVIYCLHILYNFCKQVLGTPELIFFLTKKGTKIVSYLSNHRKVEGTLFRLDNGKDIRIELYTLCLEAFSSQKMWNNGLQFLELALSQINREFHRYLVKYLIIFKSKMKINIRLDIIRIIVDFDEVGQSNLWLMAAHASTSYNTKFLYYKAAVESLFGVNNVLLRIEVLSQFLNWLVLIKFSPEVLCTLLEDALGQLIEYVFVRLYKYMGDGCGKFQKKHSPLVPEFNYHNRIGVEFHESFEEWTFSEIDYFFQLSVISLILSGRYDGLSYDSNLRVILFSIYSMLNQTVVQDTELREANHDQCKKGKVSTKFNANTTLATVPHNLSEWSQYSLNHTQLIYNNQASEKYLKSPNLTMYYLNYFNEELKFSVFSHYQFLPLILMNYISTTRANCPRSWSHLSYINLIIYSKKFNLDSSYDFWKGKLCEEYFVKEDRSILYECTKIIHNQEIVSPVPILPAGESATCNNNIFEIFNTFQQSDFIIYLALEISNLLLELKELQAIIDIVTECEFFLKYSPKPIFDYKINTLKSSIHDAFNISIRHQNIYTRMLQDKFLPINLLIHCCFTIGNSLEHYSANEYIEQYVRLFHRVRMIKSWKYFSHVKTRFEFELATRQLDFFFSHFPFIETNKKRNLIDIEILLETLYSCFCMYNASQNFIDSISSLEKYVYYLCKLATLKDDAIPLETCSKYFVKTLYFHKKLIQLYYDTLSYLDSVSFDFDVFLDNSSPLCSELTNSEISFSSFGITIFERCTKLSSKKLKLHLSSPIQKIFDAIIYQKFQSLEFTEQLIQIGMCIITESIAILISLQNIYLLKIIEVQLSRAMVALYHYYGTETDQMWVCNNSDSYRLSLPNMFENREFNEHENSQSKAIFYIASGNKYFQRITLLSLKQGININFLIDINYTHVSIIGKFERKLTVQYLALYQSVSFSICYQSIILNILENLVDSKLAVSTKIENEIHILSNYPRLNVRPDFFEIVKEMRSHFRYLILQHSPDEEYVYFAYTQQPPQVPKVSKGVSPLNDWYPSVGQCKVRPSVLSTIILMLECFAENTTTTLIKSDNKNIGGYNVTPNCSEFESISAAMQAYFSSIISNIEPYILAESNHQDLVLFILCDEILLSLPIEAITTHSPLNLFGMITREFSLQMLNYRFMSVQSFPNNDTLRDKSKETAPPCHNDVINDIIDISHTRYLIDPYDYLLSSSSFESESFHKLLRNSFTSHQKLTSKWTGVFGTRGYQGISDTWHLFKADNLIILLSEFFTSQYQIPKLISPSNRKDYNLMIIFDQICPDGFHCGPVASTHPSSFIAGLLSIMGGNIIVTNTWPVKRDIFIHGLTSFLDYLFKEGYSICKAIEILNTKYFASNEGCEFNNFGIRTQLEFITVSYGLGYLHSV